MGRLKAARLKSGRPGRGSEIKYMSRLIVEVGEEEIKVFMIAKIRCIWKRRLRAFISDKVGGEGATPRG